MRRLMAPVALTLILAAAGCRWRGLVTVTEEGNRPAASQVRVNDPQGTLQLVSGFHELYANAWRWTAGRFSVVLAPPPGTAVKGAVLELDLSVPESVIARRGAVTLSASVEDVPLAPESFSKVGRYVYRRPVPAKALSSGLVKVDFALDKYLKAGEVEGRELGLLAFGIALKPE